MFLCSLLGRVSFLNGVVSNSFRSTRNSTFWKGDITNVRMAEVVKTILGNIKRE